jgi:hypothetical protein
MEETRENEWAMRHIIIFILVLIVIGYILRCIIFLKRITIDQMISTVTTFSLFFWHFIEFFSLIYHGVMALYEHAKDRKEMRIITKGL